MTALDECFRRAPDFRLEAGADGRFVTRWTMRGESFEFEHPPILEATLSEEREHLARQALAKMVKEGPVWNETWEHGSDGVISAGDGLTEQHESRIAWEQSVNFGAFGYVGENHPFEPTPRDEQRAELAAMAPELVRLLLDIEWGGSCMSYGSNCPSCHACPGERETHQPDCKLDAALRKAGVR